MELDETMREYTRTRMKMYIEKAQKNNWREGEEEKLYDNIMELISMHDYCYIGLNVSDSQLLDDVKHQHELKTQLKKLNGLII